VGALDLTGTGSPEASVRIYRDGHCDGVVGLSDLDSVRLDDGMFAWVTLATDDVDGLARAARHFGFALPRDMSRSQAPGLVDAGHSLAITLQAIAPGAEARRDGAFTAHVGRNYIVSRLPWDARLVESLAARFAPSPALLAHGADYLLYALVDVMTEPCLPAILAFEERAGALEGCGVAASVDRQALQALLDLQRALADYRRILRLDRPAIEALALKTRPVIDREVRPYFRDVLDRLRRADALAATIQESLATFGKLEAVPAADTGRTVRTLTAWALMLALLTCFTALYSMYFPGIPGIPWRWGYVAFLTIVGGLCGAVYWRFHRHRWL